MGKRERREDLDHHANGQGCGCLSCCEQEQQGLQEQPASVSLLCWSCQDWPGKLALRLTTWVKDPAGGGV